MTISMEIMINITVFSEGLDFPPMIVSDQRDSKWEWFHYSCVGVKKVPKGRWFCRDCKAL